MEFKLKNLITDRPQLMIARLRIFFFMSSCYKNAMHSVETIIQNLAFSWPRDKFYETMGCWARAGCLPRLSCHHKGKHYSAVYWVAKLWTLVNNEEIEYNILIHAHSVYWLSPKFLHINPPDTLPKCLWSLCYIQLSFVFLFASSSFILCHTYYSTQEFTQIFG